MILLCILNCKKDDSAASRFHGRFRRRAIRHRTTPRGGRGYRGSFEGYAVPANRWQTRSIVSTGRAESFSDLEPPRAFSFCKLHARVFPQEMASNRRISRTVGFDFPILSLISKLKIAWHGFAMSAYRADDLENQRLSLLFLQRGGPRTAARSRGERRKICKILA